MRLSPFKDRRSRAGLQSDRCAGRPKGLKEFSEPAGAPPPASSDRARWGKFRAQWAGAAAVSFGKGSGAIGGATGAFAVGLSWFSASHSMALWTRV